MVNVVVVFIVGCFIRRATIRWIGAWRSLVLIKKVNYRLLLFLKKVGKPRVFSQGNLLWT